MTRRNKKAARRFKDGLPVDPKAWTVEDWRDLYRALEYVRRRVARRHKGEKTDGR